MFFWREVQIPSCNPSGKKKIVSSQTLSRNPKPNPQTKAVKFFTKASLRLTNGQQKEECPAIVLCLTRTITATFMTITMVQEFNKSSRQVPAF
jgi:hypothetical protein